MRIQDIKGWTDAGRLILSWTAVEETPRAICVAVSTDMEFAGETLRMFLVPSTVMKTPSAYIALDLGSGQWFYRVGAVVGSETSGSVDWSGVYGPIEIVSQKPLVPLPPARLSLIGQGSTLEGVRLETGIREAYYTFIDMSTDTDFRVGYVRTVYVRDPGKGVFELDGLKEGETYHLRIRTSAGIWGEFPTGSRIETLCAPVELRSITLVKPTVRALGSHLRGTVDTATRQVTGTDTAQAAANRVLLREARDKPVQRFSSYADYMRMVQAQTVNKVSRV